MIYLSPTSFLTEDSFCEQMADVFSERYKHIPVAFSPQDVASMIRICRGHDPWPEDLEEYVACAQVVCQALEASDRIQESLRATDTSANAQERPLEPILTISVPQTAQGHEMALMEAARSTNLANGWDKLSHLFDFGENFDRMEPKGPVSPQDLCACLGYGVSMAKSGVFITAKAILRLQAMGHDHIVEQFAAEKGLGYSTVSNWLRMESRIPEGSPARQLLDPTAISEILCARFSSNEDENKRIREELLQEACDKKFDSGEARSAVLARKGEGRERQERQSLRERVEELEWNLARLLERYLRLANSGDCGHWNPEEEEEVKEARRVLRLPVLVEQVSE